ANRLSHDLVWSAQFTASFDPRDQSAMSSILRDPLVRSLGHDALRVGRLVSPDRPHDAREFSGQPDRRGVEATSIDQSDDPLLNASERRPRWAARCAATMTDRAACTNNDRRFASPRLLTRPR